jgi:hypothetical protein
MLIISFALWSLVSILTPSTAKSIVAIIVARVCVGVAQGFLIPSIHTVLSQVELLRRLLLLPPPGIWRQAARWHGQRQAPTWRLELALGQARRRPAAAGRAPGGQSCAEPLACPAPAVDPSARAGQGCVADDVR